jgi:hypothetical protein
MGIHCGSQRESGGGDRGSDPFNPFSNGLNGLDRFAHACWFALFIFHATSCENPFGNGVHMQRRFLGS